eukprot:6203012-Pleurochrysis_carterae.AAC.1
MHMPCALRCENVLCTSPLRRHPFAFLREEACRMAPRVESRALRESDALRGQRRARLRRTSTSHYRLSDETGSLGPASASGLERVKGKAAKLDAPDSLSMSPDTRRMRVASRSGHSTSPVPPACCVCTKI